MSLFSDELLEALGAWQNGWREVQARREEIAGRLCRQAAGLPFKYRSVSVPCFRKRFIHKGEMVDLLLNDSRDEGVASWTLDLRFAERLKGLTRLDAVSAAIFEHVPVDSEVVVSFPALWACADFQDAVDGYSSRDGRHAKALLHFKDSQQEVVLKAPLRGSEMIALTGASSPFDELCDRIGLPEDRRDAIFSSLIQANVYPGEVQYIDREATQRVITRSIQRLYLIVWEHLENQGIGVLEPS